MAMTGSEAQTRPTGTRALDPAKLEAFMGQMVGDMGAAVSGLLVYLGDELGLYRAMAGAGPVTAGELAASTATDARYVQEWLDAQASAGYVEYDGATGRYELPPEQAMALADEDSEFFVCGAFAGVTSVYADAEMFSEAFRSGDGVGWQEHDPRLFVGTERLFRPGYRAHLVPDWLSALDGVEAKLDEGASVADIGCGHGASTILMAGAFPRSQFVGFDFHPQSVATARQRAEEAGVADRCRFEVATGKDFPGSGYDLVCYFDCLHDMGDPQGALVHTREALAPDGVVMLVEPNAGDHPEDNHNPLGRAFYGLSTVVCTMASKAQEVGLALGAQAGPGRLADVAGEAGLHGFRQVAETPFNMVIELRA